MKRLLVLFIVTFIHLPGFSQLKDSTKSSSESQVIATPNVPLQILVGTVSYSAGFFLLGGNNILTDKLPKDEGSSFRVGIAPLVASLASIAGVNIVGEATSHRQPNYLFTLLGAIASFFVSDLASKQFENKSNVAQFAGYMVPSVAIPILVFYFTHTDKPSVYF